MPGKTIYRRVGVFHSQEVHVEASPGEWVRDDGLSTAPISTLINNWCSENGVEPVSVSTPSIEELHSGRTSDGLKARVYRVSVSVIYVPAEIIDYGETKETAVHNINPAGLPAGLQELIAAVQKPTG